MHPRMMLEAMRLEQSQLRKTATQGKDSELKLMCLALMNTTGLLQWQNGELTTLPSRLGWTADYAEQPFNWGERWQKLPSPDPESPLDHLPESLSERWKSAVIQTLQGWQERELRDDPGHHYAVQVALEKLGVPQPREQEYCNAEVMLVCRGLISEIPRHVLVIKDARAIAWALENPEEPLQENLGEICSMMLHPDSNVLLRTDRLLKEKGIRRLFPHEKSPVQGSALPPIILRRGEPGSLIAQTTQGSFEIKGKIPRTKI